MRRERIKTLVHAGHSAEKALEIAINIERGDTYSINWFAQIEKMAA